MTQGHVAGKWQSRAWTQSSLAWPWVPQSSPCHQALGERVEACPVASLHHLLCPWWGSLGDPTEVWVLGAGARDTPQLRVLTCGLFLSDSKGLSNPAEVEALREKVYASLEAYCKHKYPEQPGRWVPPRPTHTPDPGSCLQSPHPLQGHFT